MRTFGLERFGRDDENTTADLIVCRPFGDILWDRLSRIGDAEMKRLMIDVVDRRYQFIRQL